jgi:hypothetical protein
MVLLVTMCRYDCQMLGNSWSSSALTFGSLCGIYYEYSSLLIMLKRSPHSGGTTLDPMLTSILPNSEGWMKNFFVAVLTTGSDLGTYTNFLAVPGEELAPVSGSFSFGSLGKRLVVYFLDDIVPAT